MEYLYPRRMIILLPSPGIIHAGETDSSDFFFSFQYPDSTECERGRGSGGCGIKDIVSLATVNISATKEKGVGLKHFYSGLDGRTTTRPRRNRQ